MKRKSMATLIGGLLSVCLIGVGFASWIIVQGDSEEVTGTVKVETVQKRTATFTDVQWGDNNNNLTSGELTKNLSGVNGDDIFVFGKGAAPSGTNYNWLRNDTIGEEIMNLTLTGKIEVEGGNYDDIVEKATYKFVVEGDLVGYERAVSEGYITGLANNTIGELTVQTDGTFSVTFSMEWGIKFHNNNPYTYYNGLKITDELVTEATNNLNSLQECLAGVTFKVVLEVTVK